MSWSFIVQVLIQFFGAAMLDWFEKLFIRAARELDAGPKWRNVNLYKAEDAENELWNKAEELLLQAERETWWIDFAGRRRNVRRRAFFNEARDIAEPYVGQFATLARALRPDPEDIPKLGGGSVQHLLSLDVTE